jgi:uncharacterized protein (DUF305 family)
MFITADFTPNQNERSPRPGPEPLGVGWVYSWRMKKSLLAAVIVIAATGAACKTGAGGSPRASAAPPPPTAQAPTLVQPGAPGQASRPVSAAQATDLSKVQYTAADAKFMQGMIGHHTQAVEMVALLKERTQWDDMRKLGMRIEVSQEDEIKMMGSWLRSRGQEVPGPHAMHMHGATLMPGMLSEEEMAKLAEAKGPQFDRLFLEGMIKHHGGAISMVEELFATPGAGQDGDIYAFASDVVSDQRMEIDRMGAMLMTLLKERK